MSSNKRAEKLRQLAANDTDIQEAAARTLGRALLAAQKRGLNIRQEYDLSGLSEELEEAALPEAANVAAIVKLAELQELSVQDLDPVYRNEPLMVGLWNHYHDTVRREAQLLLEQTLVVPFKEGA